MANIRLTNEKKNRFSRRAMLKTATVAAVGMAMGQSAKAVGPPATPVEYGTSSGHLPIDSPNIFPLLTAWLLATTAGDPSYSLTAEAMCCVARIGPNTAQDIINAYTNTVYTDASGVKHKSFDDVRNAFLKLANKYAAAGAPYSGGQCPDNVNTLAPIAGLYGTITSGNCKKGSGCPGSTKK
jgi:hypothetical protein